MTLFEILSKDERVIVLSSEEDGALYTWNQSLTLQCWELTSRIGETRGFAYTENEWDEVDIQTLSEEPKDFAAARKAACKWFLNASKEEGK